MCEQELALRPQGEYANHTIVQRLVLDDTYGPDHLEMAERIHVIDERFQTVIQTESDLLIPIIGARSLGNTLSSVLFSRESLYKYLESSLMADRVSHRIPGSRKQPLVSHPNNLIPLTDHPVVPKTPDIRPSVGRVIVLRG